MTRSAYDITPGVKFSFTDAGHVVGSAAVHLCDHRKTARNQLISPFSGDVGRYGDMLLNKPPAVSRRRTTFCWSRPTATALHKDVGAIEDALLESHQTYLRGEERQSDHPGLQRGPHAGAMLYALNALELKGVLPDVPYYVDSPLSEKATHVIDEAHPEVYNNDVKEVMRVDADPFGFKGLKFIQSTQESIALNDDVRPCVIISSSGMAEAGRVKHHIKNNINNKKNTILMVGYAEPNSLGGRLARGEKEVHIFGEQYHVTAEVQSIKSMSAHGDYDDLLHFLSCQDPKLVKKLFLVHGEYEVQQHFAQKLKEKGFAEVEIPYQHQKVVLE
jgi:metallo-beta-lactamase family protein